MPLPDPTPLARDDRWIFAPPSPPRPVLAVEGTLAAVGAREVVVAGDEAPVPKEVVPLPGGPALEGEVPPEAAEIAIALAGDTTYYVEGRPTTFDQLPEGVPARVTYELREERPVALRVEILEGEPEPMVPRR